MIASPRAARRPRSRACCLYLAARPAPRSVLGRTEREVQRQADQRAPARSFLVHRFAPADEPRIALAVLQENAARARAPQRPSPQVLDAYSRRRREAQAADMMYEEVTSGSRTRRTLTGAASVLFELKIDGPLVVGLALIARSAGRAVQRLRQSTPRGAHRAAAAAWHHRHAVAGAREPNFLPAARRGCTRSVPAAAHRCRDRPRRYGRAALAEFRPVPLPAFRLMKLAVR